MKTEFHVDFELEEDGRWIAEIKRLPGALVYGSSKEEARLKVEALARQIISEQR